MNKRRLSIPLIILYVVLVLCLIYVINLRMKAVSFGSNLGSNAGSAAGKAIGSLDGMTRGRTEGTEAGKEAGLSAEDTEAVISNQLHQVENLEVLVASVKLSNFHSIGQDDPLRQYAALYLVNGNVIFTVDMNKAEITTQSNVLHITLPGPVGTLYIDDSSVEKVAEYQTKLFNGDAESGFDAYLNTMKKMQEASEETLDNYDTLLSSAEEAAKRQVITLAKSVLNNYDQILVTFTD